MRGQTSVVTSERFASGLTYEQYIAQIKVNSDRFQEFFEKGQITSEDAEAFRKLAQHPQGPAKMLVIGEDWCPDVWRGMPAMAQLAKAVGMEIRIFPRDENLDIMNEFLDRGEFMSIPTVVFYTKDHQYICHWIERPVLANQERSKIEIEIKKEMPGTSDQDIRPKVRERTQARYPAWQQESIREIRQLLAKKLGSP